MSTEKEFKEKLIKSIREHKDILGYSFRLEFDRTAEAYYTKLEIVFKERFHELDPFVLNPKVEQ